MYKIAKHQSFTTQRKVFSKEKKPFFNIKNSMKELCSKKKTKIYFLKFILYKRHFTLMSLSKDLYTIYHNE